MSYSKWNNLIANYFFNEEMAGKEVLLFVDEALINEIGSKIGEGMSDFISSVIQGPSWVHDNHGICHKAFETFNSWRSKKLRFPPYIGYLALFVLAGYVEDEKFSQIAYYPKLRALLGENTGIGQYPYFHKMINLWMDLEKWSVEDKLEELGRFNVRIRGGWRHVGLPLSQTIISSKERKYLPLIFNRADLISSDFPNSEIITKILLEYGQDVLTKKTIRLLSGEEDDEHLLQALVDLVDNELDEWDGSLPEDLTYSNPFVKSRLRICLNLNRIKKEATFSFRINTQNEFPSESLVFQKRGELNLYSCTRSIDNWSTELKSEDGLTLDATQFNWLSGELVEDLSNRWKSTLNGTPVRIFLEGSRYGLPGLVETARIERGTRFILLCCKSHSNKILEWGRNSCENFGEINYAGIPSGWHLFHGSNPYESCIGIKELMLSSEIKIRLVDGLRLGKGNTFLKAAPPKILLENHKGNEAVLVNDKPIPYNKKLRHWELNRNLPLNQTLTISVLDQGHEIRKANFKITDSKLSIRNRESFIEKSRLHEGWKESMIIGVNVYNTDIVPINKQDSLPTYLSNEIFFIGQRPGEIYHWQGKTLVNLEWEPIWAIWKVRRRKWKVHFCATKKLAECQIKEEFSNQKSLKFWRTVMCKMKKSIEKPEFSPLCELWESYLEVAKRV
ncbi:hypothetical protein C2I27_15240 [Priestia megaterium]|uniref:hypothetical protein n=1 Tax=Priestia megaterium TaxID=1404 RepID=UPI000D51866C|nr:hypothetical protein [Priestia megaterium]PVC67982.1 hypothetical protein C2I27_15240 [Priestia megaterium]